MRMASIGAIEGGGVNRQGLSEQDIAARQFLVDWALGRGYRVQTDEIANIFVTRAGRCNELAGTAVATGSHIDSQPRGERFDGVYGVLAGLEILQALDEAAIETDLSLASVAWTNEEGSRFAPGAMGSSVIAGHRQLCDFANARGRDDIRLHDAVDRALQALPNIQPLPRRPEFGSYLELHFEQGPVLERRNITIGAVTGIRGARWFDVAIEGASAHAGTTPMSHRRDALTEAVSVLAALRDTMRDSDDLLRFTVGRLDVVPNSPDTIPQKVTFSIDLRHPDAAVLAARGDDIGDVCRSAVERCTLQVHETFPCTRCEFPGAIVAAAENATRALSLQSHRLTSGAFHDALFVAGACPTGMIFVPSAKGLSHHPSEYTRPDQLAAGARVSAAALMELSRAPNPVSR